MELKKAWNRFKKDIEKELGIKNGFYMTATQMRGRTATYLVNNDKPYEDEIREMAKRLRDVLNSLGYTPDEKIEYIEKVGNSITKCKEMIAMHGTKWEEAKATLHDIQNSEALKKFEENAGVKVKLAIDPKVQYGVTYNYIRFNY